jgi:hypothetical protein
MSVNTTQIEKEILNNIEKLITIISKISQQGKENSHNILPEAEYLINKTNPLLEQLLQRKDLPLEQIYRQLITQKLPYTEAQNSIANLEQAFEPIFALPIFQQDNKKEPPTDTSEETITLPSTENNCPSKKSKVSLNDYLAALFPREKVLKNYYLHNIKLDYFIPQKKLAVLLTPVYYRRSLSVSLLLRKGIQLIELSPQDLDNSYQLYQKFCHHAL